MYSRYQFYGELISQFMFLITPLNFWRCQFRVFAFHDDMILVTVLIQSLLLLLLSG